MKHLHDFKRKSDIKKSFNLEDTYIPHFTAQYAQYGTTTTTTADTQWEVIRDANGMYVWRIRR